MNGYVYILLNSSLPNMVKIGRTTKPPELRATELSSTGTPGRFIVAYSVLVENCVEVEAEMHAIYAARRHTNNREFFEVDSSSAIVTLNEITVGKRISIIENEAVLNAKPSTSVLYLAKLPHYPNFYRIGFVNKGGGFLRSEEFINIINDLYNLKLSNITLEYEKEFENINVQFFQKINFLIDNHINSTKRHHASSFSEKYDLRTLHYKNMCDPSPSSIFSNILELIQPLAKAAKSVQESLNIETKQNKLEAYKKIGI